MSIRGLAYLSPRIITYMRIMADQFCRIFTYQLQVRVVELAGDNRITSVGGEIS